MLPYITAEQVSAMGNLGTALAAGFVAWQGFKSLSAWQAERIGGRKIEVAEESLVHFYEMDNVLSIVRSPFGYSYELEGRDAPPDESSAQKRGRENGFRVFKRIKDHHEVIEKYRLTCIKIKAIFGNDLFNSFNVLMDCLHDVQVAAQMLNETPYGGFDDFEFQRGLEKDIWYYGPKAESDPKSIEARIKLAMTVVETQLGAVIGRH